MRISDWSSDVCSSDLVIEQQLTGIDNLDYFSSSSSSSGRASITLTFKPGTDPDIAQVQVQNKVALATPRLPSEGVQQGVVVAKANPGFLMIAALRSSNPESDKDARRPDERGGGEAGDS